MAGNGSRFVKEGYKEPKPLILVNGKPMIELVIENLKPKRHHQFIFICHANHTQNYPLKRILEGKSPGCKIIEVDKITEGPACTALFAKKYINNTDQLMIANCDQYIDIDINQYLSVLEKNIDALIMTMKANDEKWSYIELNEKKEITRVVEKEIVSDEATVGIYNYKYGQDFVKSAEAMIAKNLRVNNEFYVAPAYNEMISDGKKIEFFNIGTLGKGMHGLGTPDDLKAYLTWINGK